MGFEGRNGAYMYPVNDYTCYVFSQLRIGGGCLHLTLMPPKYEVYTWTMCKNYLFTSYSNHDM